MKPHITLFNEFMIIWKIRLFSLGGHPVDLGSIIISLLVLFAGLIFASFFKKALRRRLTAASYLRESSIAITEKLVYYFLILLVLLLALRIINIPLTAFTFLGGALAIGVGFGAQKLINNFISGFILMAEQPIKVGDLIELDGQPGWIDDIGVRSTRVRTFSNINILVPNSYFLENNITNWTHNDNMIRCEILVGVIYGSPVETVKEKLIEAASENLMIHKQPPPLVWFSDFGDNALIFKLLFWITITPQIGRQQIESDVRFRIDALFRESSLIIAFPQRDVHLDTSTPLQFRIIKEPTDSPISPEP